MKSIFKLVPVFCVLLFVLSSCKSQKAVVDANQEPEEVVEVTPAPAPVKEEPKVDPEAVNRALDARLSNYFGQIANATSVAQANNNIREAVGMFSNGEAPVLIVFYEANGAEDYDEPTTIYKYLSYLKDLKVAPHKVKQMVMDSQGKIKELVLEKK
ncbi:nucleoid-structuring protein H-NS [Roseivirga echinicomitans]